MTIRKIFARFSFICQRRFTTSHEKWKYCWHKTQKGKTILLLWCEKNIWLEVYVDNPSVRRIQCKVFGFSSDLSDPIRILELRVGPDFYVYVPCTSLTDAPCTQVNTARLRRKNVYTTKPCTNPMSTILFSHQFNMTNMCNQHERISPLMRSKESFFARNLRLRKNADRLIDSDCNCQSPILIGFGYLGPTGIVVS